MFDLEYMKINVMSVKKIIAHVIYSNVLVRNKCYMIKIIVELLERIPKLLLGMLNLDLVTTYF